MSELLVAMVIGGILSATAVPSMSSLKASYDLSAATNQLAFEITRSRMQAVGQNKYTRVRRLNSGVYARESSADGNTYTIEAMTTLNSGIALSVGDSGNPTFNRNGLAASATTYTLTKQIGGRQFTKIVSINSLGRVTVP